MPGDAHSHDLDELMREVARLRNRYGDDIGFAAQARLEGSMTSHRALIKLHRNRLEEIAEEVAVLERELVGYQAGLVAYLLDLIERARIEHEEGWSPVPVIGYRMWALHRDRLEGVRTVWDGPSLSAKCAAGYNDIEVPHTDGRCGRLGCGVYAAMRPDPVLESFTPGAGHGYVAGRVELTGKVVEHETGYRAQHATAVAIVAVSRNGTLATTHPTEIRALFAQPYETMNTVELRTEWTRHMTIDFLTDTQEDPWTSESNAA